MRAEVKVMRAKGRESMCVQGSRAGLQARRGKAWVGDRLGRWLWLRLCDVTLYSRVCVCV